MRKYCVIGSPIGHTMSPFIHEKLFALSCISAEYTVKEILLENLENDFRELCALNGFNITIPYKMEIIRFLDEIDVSAKICGAVNTVKCENGKTTGYNTDMFGFERAVQSAGIDLCGSVLIAGCGGAARAVAASCLMAGCDVTFAVRERSQDKAIALSIKLADVSHGGSITVCSDAAVRESDLLINTTPVGMYPNAGTLPLSKDWVVGTKAVFDAVYNPEDTALLCLAKSLEKRCVGGMEMLVWQAAKAHEIWCGAHFEDSDIEKIVDMAKNELASR